MNPSDPPARPARPHRLRRWRVPLAVLSLLLVLVVSGPRNEFGPLQPAGRAQPPTEAAQIENWLQASEAAVPGIRSGNAKGVVWAGEPGRRTPWAVVYLHGFSASRLETAPLAEIVGRGLGANVYYTRLTGHGLPAQAMAQARPQDWLADGVEALRIGRALGDRVLVISCSTGSTIATWLATSEFGADVAAHVFVSPNFGPRDKRSEIINGPWGRQIAIAIEGGQHGKPSSDPREANAWTSPYPTQAIFPMMALVKQVRERDLSQFAAPLLVYYSERDETVDVAEIKSAFARIGSQRKTLSPVGYSQSPGQHVLVGDIRDPAAVGPMAEGMVRWVRGLGL